MSYSKQTKPIMNTGCMSDVYDELDIKSCGKMGYLLLTNSGIKMENELHLIWCQTVNENWFQMEGECNFMWYYTKQLLYNIKIGML